MDSKFKSKWEVGAGGTALYPVAVWAGDKEIFTCHAWDTSGPQKAAAIVAIHNAMLSPETADLGEISISLRKLPDGPWSVRRNAMQHQTAIMPGQGLSAVLVMDYCKDADLIAEYLADLHAKATAKVQAEQAPDISFVRGLSRRAPEVNDTKKMTYGDGNAIMILAAEKMGLEPHLVAEARRQLEGTNIHPMSGAAIEKEAARLNNLLRNETSQIDKANCVAEEIKVQYGFVKMEPVEMQEFKVQFEVVGFTNSDLSDRELTESEADGFTESAVNEQTLPSGVVAVVRGFITEDGDQEEGERKVFACVTLRVLVKDERAAKNFVPPQALLSKLADMMALDVDGNVDLSLEGNWEVTLVDHIDVIDEANRLETEKVLSPT